MSDATHVAQTAPMWTLKELQRGLFIGYLVELFSSLPISVISPYYFPMALTRNNGGIVVRILHHVHQVHDACFSY